jgi:hypothetical protein
MVLGAALTACGGRATGPTTDGPIKDTATKKDLTSVDKGPRPDLTPGTCVEDSDCRVINDCCSCWAVDPWVFPEQCLETCPTPICDLFGFQAPKAVCIESHCHLAEGKPNHCQTTADCTLYQDCCYCMAVPWTVTPGTCPHDCINDACERSGLGLDKMTGLAHFTCFQGECKLMSVD